MTWICIFLAALGGEPPNPMLRIAVDGVSVPAEFGYASWYATTAASGGKHLLTGELALLESEVSPVASALLANNLQVTALASRFLREQPRVVFMNIRGYGARAELERAVRPALDIIGRRPALKSPPASSSRLDTAKIAGIVGREGERAGAVFRIAAAREELRVTDMGANLSPSSRAAFFGSDADGLIAGQIAMQAIEIDAVLKALRRHGLELTALYNHSAAARPLVWFAHFQGRGSTARLAEGFRAALDELGPPPRVSPMKR
jgi:hypothetical protein